jgi:hypothetical protein
MQWFSDHAEVKKNACQTPKYRDGAHVFPQLVLPNLVMTFTVCHGFSMALIEIDGLPFLKMVDLSMANC